MYLYCHAQVILCNVGGIYFFKQGPYISALEPASDLNVQQICSLRIQN